MQPRDEESFDRLPGLVVVLDTEGRVRLWNRAAAELTGIPKDEAWGRTLVQLVGAGEAVRGADTPARYEDRWLTRRGERRLILWSHTSTRDSEGREVFIENGIELPSFEAEAPWLREEVIGALAHDLRSPLHAIKLTASLLRGRLPPSEPSVARESVEAILTSTERARRIVEDLSDVTRLEGGRLELDPKNTPASPLFHQAADAARAAVEASGIELSIDIPPDLPEIRVDRARILQASNKLIENALKLSRRGGRVQICAREESGFVIFSVEDNGPGIAPDRLPALLGRVWAHRDDRHKLHIGLPLARGLVEAHGGQLSLESEPGRGTRAVFRIPIAPAPTDAPPRPGPG